MKVLVGTKKQFKMTLDEEFVDRLRSVADRTGRDSAQHLAEEVLTLYLPLYVAVHDATQRTVSLQTNMMMETVRQHRHLAPVGADIRGGDARMTKDDIRRSVIGDDEISEIESRIGKRTKVPVLKEKAS